MRTRKEIEKNISNQEKGLKLEEELHKDCVKRYEKILLELREELESLTNIPENVDIGMVFEITYYKDTQQYMVFNNGGGHSLVMITPGEVGCWNGLIIESRDCGYKIRDLLVEYNAKYLGKVTDFSIQG